MKPDGRAPEAINPPRELAPAGAGGKVLPGRPKRRANSSARASGGTPKRTQRERLIDAMIELCAQGGYQGVTIAQLCARAGVSPATFYEQFADKEDCLSATYRASAERILGGLRAAVADRDWLQAARAALGGLFQAVQSDPQAGRLLLIGALAGGDAIRIERARVLQEFEHRCEELMEHPSQAGQTLDVPVLAVAGALRHIVARHLRTDAEDELPSLLDDGLAWLASYAIPAGSSRWSTSAAALLSGAPEPSPPPAWAPERLPPGNHGLPASVIARSQRTRLIYGTAEAMMAKGYAEATVADIVAAAGVARPVFYEHFEDKQHAFLEAQEHPTQYILDRCADAYFSAGEWSERLWCCFQTLIGLIVSNPAISHLRLIECYAAGPIAIRRAEEITRSFTIFLKEGYNYSAKARSLPRLSSQAIAGAIFEIVQHHIARRDYATLAAHLPQLAYIAIAPFTGAQEAIALVQEMAGRESPGAIKAARGPRAAVREPR